MNSLTTFRLTDIAVNVPIFINQLVRVLQLALVVLLFVAPIAVQAQDTATDSGTSTVIPDKPNPPRLVNDFVGILSSSDREQLEQKLRAYNDSTSTQLVVVIVKTTEPYPIGDFAFQVGRKWGIGQQGKNNGLVLAWATETRKVYIATGYGMEGSIPDAIAKRIISNTIVPAFKQEQYFQGLDAATTEIIQRANGEYKAEPASDTGDGGIPIIFIVFAIIIIIFIFSRRNGGGGNNRNRGGGFWPIFFPTSTYSGWGGSSGGGWSGGGGSGGGFGGFGGGSFGGGGAGGDY